MWKNLGMEATVRGENLNLEQFAEIANYIKNRKAQ